MMFWICMEQNADWTKPGVGHPTGLTSPVPVNHSYLFHFIHMSKGKNIYLPNKASFAYVCSGLVTWATLNSGSEANKLRLQLKTALLFDGDYTKSENEKPAKWGLCGPFLIRGFVIPDQNQLDWRLSCHFNLSTGVWGCAINNWPRSLPAGGNQIRGTVWGCW